MTFRVIELFRGMIASPSSGGHECLTLALLGPFRYQDASQSELRESGSAKARPAPSSSTFARIGFDS